MKKILNATIKVKHVLIALVLLVGMAIGFAVNRPHFRPKRHMAKIEHRPEIKRGQQMRGRMEYFKIQYNKLDDVEKHTIDSLRSLIKDGDSADRRVIFKEMHDIMKGD